jgi:hypothetical protein
MANLITFRNHGLTISSYAFMDAVGKDLVACRPDFGDAGELVGGVRPLGHRERVAR